MSSNRPCVSIGVPVYNGESFLAKALDSILAQTFEDYEVIISDNASTDGTAEIARRFAAEDARIRYYRSPKNLGAAKNFNRVFELSSGRYFRWLAADDVCAPDFLARFVDILENDPSAVLAYCKPLRIDEQENLLPEYYDVLRSSGWRIRPALRFRQVLDQLTFHDSKYAPMYIFGLIRSNALRRTRPIGNYVYPDPTVLAELALIGTFCEVPEHLSFLRSHPDSLSCMYTQNAQKTQEFFDPAIRGRVLVLLYRWRHYLELYFSVGRSDLSVREKLLSFAYVTKLCLRKGASKCWFDLQRPLSKALGLSSS